LYRYPNPISEGRVLLRKISAKNQGSPFGLPLLFSFQLGYVFRYCGFLRTGGFLAGAGAALVSNAPFSITMTKGLGV
jgi:hypothetical protein